MTNNKSLIYLVIAFALGFFSFWIYSNNSVDLPEQSTENIKATTEDSGATSENKPSVEEAEPKVAVKSKNSLDLSSQGLNKLPSYVPTRTELEELDVSNNNLTGALPSEIGKLKNLRILRAANNSMTGVPAEIGHLPNLEILDLSNNQLTGLPNELANLKKLKLLNLSGNDYSEQDLNIIKKGLPADVKLIL